MAAAGSRSRRLCAAMLRFYATRYPSEPAAARRQISCRPPRRVVPAAEL